MASRFAARTETKTPRGSTADDREQHRDDCASVRRVEERKAVSGMDSEQAGGMLAESRVMPTGARSFESGERMPTHRCASPETERVHVLRCRPCFRNSSLRSATDRVEPRRI